MHNSKTYMYTWKEEEDSKKEKNNSKFYFEIKIDTLMIGARKCQVSRSSVNFISQLLHGKILQCLKATGPHLQQML